MKPRRSIIKIIALLLAWLVSGAALNVAVAWGLAAYSPFLKGKESFAYPAYSPQSPHAGLVNLDTSMTWTRRAIGARLEISRAVLSPEQTAVEHENSQYCQLEVGWPIKSMRLSSLLRYHWDYQLHKQSDLGAICWSDAIVLSDWPQFHTGKWLFPHRALPLRPLWSGFAFNTLFYAGVLWMLFCGPSALRRMIRRRRGRCPACAYPIGQSPVCTECGAALRPH